MLSLFQLNDNNTYTTGNVKLEAFDDKGKPVDFGSGSGDNEGRFGQFALYNFKIEDFIKSKEWTFEISGLYLLNYNKK